MTSGPSSSSPVPVPSKKTTATRAQPPLSVSVPLQNTSAAPESSVLTSSSPIYSRAHPFLRKFQTTVQKAVAQAQQQNQSVFSSAFSTSATSPSSSSDNSDNASNKCVGNSVDEKIAAVSSGRLPVNPKSPTLAAAKATDAIIQMRLGQAHHDGRNVHDHIPTLDESVYAEEAFQKSAAHQGCGCSHHGAAATDSDSDDDARVEPSNFPPISEEAREFSERLLGQNKAWARKTEQDRPGFFAKLEKQQKPQVLWIGCSDSRVPANQIVNLDPGEIFVHRNIANVVTHTDMNLLSVLEYAVDVLKVRHVIVCGHYGCGGVAASLTQKQFGVIDNWLRNIKDLYTIHRKKFDTLPHGGKEQQDLLTELNVIQSALNVCHTSIIQKAWSRGEKLSVHGWCYRLSDGVIRDLGLCIEGPGNVEEVYHVMDEVKSGH
ncbi:hypothetical protein EC957_010435 [Mortierella hygrophila]|uniref:Carbonic anhydrase n=1 Tax=Mortierella hygrophila TaxID=979708 RepID=A0A9P6FAK7_9FUNG|nr:hypothetical protein EC957_010435 [Mortierella hygrophila]